MNTKICCCAISVSSACLAGTAFAQTTAVPIATYTAGMSAFAESPNGSVIYAAEPSENSVAVINAATLQVVKTVPIGSDPVALALSPDGSTLYAADFGSNFIGVMNTQTLTESTSPIPLSSGAYAFGLATGTDGRLWVLEQTEPKGISPYGNIIQINAATGASSGPAVYPSNYGVYSGAIVGSADGDTLYYTAYGLSPPPPLTKYDISGPSAVSGWSANGGGILALSHDGNTVVSGDQVYSAANGLVTGTLAATPTGYGSFAFSPDNSVLYGAANGYNSNFEMVGVVNVFNMQTMLETNTIWIGPTPLNLFLDNSANHLFVNLGSTTEVLAVPEPKPLLLLCACGAGFLLVHRRRLRPRS